MASSRELLPALWLPHTAMVGRSMDSSAPARWAGGDRIGIVWSLAAWSLSCGGTSRVALPAQLFDCARAPTNPAAHSQAAWQTSPAALSLSTVVSKRVALLWYCSMPATCSALQGPDSSCTGVPADRNQAEGRAGVQHALADHYRSF